MPRLREVPRSEVSAPIVEMMYQFLFGDRDPQTGEQGIASATIGSAGEIGLAHSGDCRRGRGGRSYGIV